MLPTGQQEAAMLPTGQQEAADSASRPAAGSLEDLARQGVLVDRQGESAVAGGVGGPGRTWPPRGSWWSLNASLQSINGAGVHRWDA